MASQSVVAVSRRVVVNARRPCRTFTTSACCRVNPLLNLSHFSASKEAQFFSKERKIPREEFHPYIQLIRSSEVDPFAPVPGTSPVVLADLERARQGKSDMQTAYNIAIINLNQHLRVARDEALQAQAALARVHDKYRREERTSFLIMLTAAAAVSLILLKTDAWEDLKDYARGTTARWTGFDWEWLGNPPSYKSTSHRLAMPTSEQRSPPVVISTISEPSLTPIEVRSDQRLLAVQSTTVLPETVKHTNRWSLSRLFWATADEHQG